MPARDSNAAEVEEADRLHDVLVAAGLAEGEEGDEGLQFPIPNNAKIARVIWAYDRKRIDGLKVRCGACPQHQHHFHGFRVELDTGEQARIGVNCGEKHFGEGAWLAAVADYDRRVELAAFQSRVVPALSAIERIMPLIDKWHDRAKTLSRELIEWRKSMPELHAVLSRAAKERDGRLERERRRRRAEVDREGRAHNQRYTEVETMAQIPAPSILLGNSPNHGLNGAKQELGAGVALLSNKRDAKGLAKAFANLRRARQHILDAADAHRGMVAILSVTWLDGLCRWANQHEELEASYRIYGGQLEQDDGHAIHRFRPTSESQVLNVVDAIMAEWPS